MTFMINELYLKKKDTYWSVLCIKWKVNLSLCSAFKPKPIYS